MTTAIAITAFGFCAVWAASPVKLANVASVDDLTNEVLLLVTDAQKTLGSLETYNDGHERLKRSASQIAILAQALAEYDADLKLKASAPNLRDAALAIVRAQSYEEVTQSFERMKQAVSGKSTETATREFDWGKLARLGTLMHAMKDRSEALRKSFRRSRDPEIESRHAMSMALMALAAHGDTHAVKDPADKAAWQDFCLQLQGHMSRAAAAVKQREPSAADHFRMGMDTCSACHEKFKP
jgi:hypothetical protein